MSYARILFLAECLFLLTVGALLLRGATLWRVSVPMPPPVAGALSHAQRWWDGRIEAAYPEPEAAFVAGLLFGERTSMPKGVTDDFRRTNLLHVTALSGYNVTLIATMVFGAAMALGVPRRRAFWATLGLLLFFILATGASPSVVRAGVMGGCALLAREVGRPHRIAYLLAFAAAVMVALAPEVLGSLSFQLSFLATLGLVVLGSRLQPRLTLLPEAFGVRETAAASLGAMAATLPLTIFTFHAVSLVGPLANLAVLPFVPLVTVAGYLSLVVPFVAALNWACLHALLLLIHWFAHLPLAYVQV